MAYEHINSKGTKYYLHKKEVKLRSGRMQTIYYFAKQAGPDSIDELPQGYTIVENERTGLPTLKKK
ncbi:MAG: hypothetical protein M1142_01930 [Patescibacteria group bacterium]|nr:hypothetical protein [Patescibacteria group bacterium]